MFSRLIQTVVNSLNPALPSHPEDIKRESLTDGQTVSTHCHRDATILAFLQFVVFWVYFLSLSCINVSKSVEHIMISLESNKWLKSCFIIILGIFLCIVFFVSPLFLSIL